ncbi:daptide-type RiPP biosynthesis methyltransferase [Clavibacter michiganensis]|nr:daptide-type RiPP biosynthesis methyltransferase [Clavibacter michiganensis]AWF96942.1 hypothetical protein BEH61_00320 [Clavibacter michiganensis subsp. insidiosus]
MLRDTETMQHLENASPPAALAHVLASGLPPEDLYSPAGSRMYERMAEFDPSERSALLRRLGGLDGDVLELACGGGRLTLPLLSLGRPVTGLDLSPEMIRILEGRYASLPASRRHVPLTALVGDMRSFDLGRTFGSIVLGTTSLFLLDRSGRRELFESVGRHLSTGGRFFVSVHASLLGPGASSTRIVPLRDERGSVALVSDYVREDGLTRDVSILHLSRSAGGELETHHFTSVVNPIPLAELDEELSGAGFRRVETIVASESTADVGALLLCGYTT